MCLFFRNVYQDPHLVPGGGAIEMETSRLLMVKARSMDNLSGPYKAICSALEVIPRTIAQNCGANTIRTLTALRAKHAEGKYPSYGINGTTGNIECMVELGVVEPLAVKMQVYKTAIETAILLLRIDDIVSGSKKRQDDGGAPGAPPAVGE